MKFAKTPLNESLKAAKSDVEEHLRSKIGLQFVYGVSDLTTPFKNLRHIIDAGTEPLGDLDDAPFRLAYGIERRFFGLGGNLGGRGIF